MTEKSHEILAFLEEKLPKNDDDDAHHYIFLQRQ